MLQVLELARPVCEHRRASASHGAPLHCSPRAEFLAQPFPVLRRTQDRRKPGGAESDKAPLLSAVALLFRIWFRVWLGLFGVPSVRAVLTQFEISYNVDLDFNTPEYAYAVKN